MSDFTSFGALRDKSKYTKSELEVLLGINDDAYRSSDETVITEQLKAGRIGPIDCSIPFSWDFGGYEARDIPFGMHSFSYQGSLLSRYWRTGEEECRDLFVAYVNDWVRAYPDIQKDDPWAWHDDATARRVYYFCTALYLFGDLMTDGQVCALMHSLKMQVRLLCRESFYKARHNHGMYQDRAVAMYGLLFSSEPEYHMLIAKERSRVYFRGVFTSDGVHKEHSPNYHIDMAASLDWFAFVYREADPEYANELTELCERMAEYIVWITMPNRKLPSIGDSRRTFRAITLWQRDPAYQWAISGGAAGKPPKETMRVFEQAGYAVIRKDWNMEDRGTWIMLLAATHGPAHKHNDDLSFLIYHDGELITEAGNRNYNYADPMTEYIYSAEAHNMFFAGEDCYPMKANHLPLLEQSAYLTRICSYGGEPGIKSVSGEQHRVPGARQIRTIKYFETLDIAEVCDEITLEEPAPMRFIYHIAPGIHVTRTPGSFKLWRKDRLAAEAYITLVSPEGDVNTVVRTPGSGDMRCSVFYGGEEPRRGSLLEVRAKGQKGKNIFKLTVELYNAAENPDADETKSKDENEKDDTEAVKEPTVMTEKEKYLSSVKYEQYIEDGKLYFIITEAHEDITAFVYYLNLNGETVLRSNQTDNRAVAFRLADAGEYRVKYYVKAGESKYSAQSEPLVSKDACDGPFEIITGEDGGGDDENGVSEKKDIYAEIRNTDIFRFSSRSSFGEFSTQELWALFGIYDGAYFKNWSYGEELEQLLSGTLEGQDFNPPCSWDFSGFADRRIPYRMQSFLREACLITEYFKTGKEEYIDLFIKYVLDWIDKHPAPDLDDFWAWHDDATARRVYFFVVLLLLFDKKLGENEIRVIKESLKIQVRLLCREDFYKFHHNHGMYQDRAVALYGLTFSEEPAYHLTLAKERTREYFGYAFTADGVHKEHSPNYHMDMAGSIYWFALAYRNEDADFSRDMTSLMDRMAEYVMWITMPNGELPSIGDSKQRVRTQPLWNANPNYLYVITGGRDGEKPDGLFKLYREAGYGIIRKDWSMDGSGTWMMLLAATHSIAHKHNDDLSFLVYHKGELITEAGNRDYNYTDPMTEYIYTSYGHNVLFVDGKGWGMKPNHLPLIDSAAYKTKITGGEDNGAVQYVTGREVRFKGVEHERTIRYLRDENVIEIEDKIKSDKPHSFRLIYHIADGVEVTPTEGGWECERGGEPVARITPIGSVPTVLSTYTGEGEDPWRTWLFGGVPEARCGTLLAVDFAGEKGIKTLTLRIELK